MNELGRALEQLAVPDHRREAARAAFTWRTIDEELLALTHDSLEMADAAVRGIGLDQSRGQTMDVAPHVNGRQPRRRAELVVHQHHGLNPPLAVLEGSPDGGVLQRVRLQAQEAGDELEGILDPVVEFPQQ